MTKLERKRLGEACIMHGRAEKFREFQLENVEGEI
jgi:hypothetical protein